MKLEINNKKKENKKTHNLKSVEVEQHTFKPQMGQRNHIGN